MGLVDLLFSENPLDEARSNGWTDLFQPGNFDRVNTTAECHGYGPATVTMRLVRVEVSSAGFKDLFGSYSFDPIGILDEIIQPKIKALHV